MYLNIKESYLDSIVREAFIKTNKADKKMALSVNCAESDNITELI